MDNHDLKKDILRMMELGITPTYRRCNVDRNKFLQAAKELSQKGKIWLTLIEDKNHPHYGDVHTMKLRK